MEPVGAHGGMDFYDHALCAALAAAGAKTLLFTSSPYPGSGPGHETREVYRGVFGSDPKWRRALRFTAASLQAFATCKRRGVQLVHFHFFHVGPLEYANVLLARLLGLSVVVTAHDVGSFRAGENVSILRRLYRHCAAVIAHSRTARATLENKLGVDASRIHVVPHGNYVGLLAALPDKQAARASLGLHADDLVLLFFGQCKKVKRLDLLIHAVSQARARGAGRLKLLVAGAMADADGPALAALMQQLLGPGVAQHHARYIPNEELPRFFAAADIAVLPYDHIYQSGVVLLATSHRVPVLTSDIDGMVEVVTHGSTGLTFRAGDAGDLADRLLELARGDWPLQTLAEAAYAQVSARHAWQRCGEDTVAVYRAALRNGVV